MSPQANANRGTYRHPLSPNVRPKKTRVKARAMVRYLLSAILISAGITGALTLAVYLIAK